MSNPTIATARLIESIIVITTSHVDEASASISRKHVVTGCEHLGKAFRDANMLKDYFCVLIIQTTRSADHKLVDWPPYTIL